MPENKEQPVRMIGTVRRQLFNEKGVCVLDETKRNTITAIGKQIAATKICGLSTWAAVANMALGTGSGGSTGLGTEIPNNTYGGGRAAATVTNETTTTTGDTAQWVHEFIFTGAYTITEEGLFDSVTIGAGHMLAYQTFGAITVASGYHLIFTHQVVFA